LLLNNGQRLIDRAAVSMIPALSMLSDSDDVPGAKAPRPSAFYYGQGVAGLDVERAALQTDDFLAAYDLTRLETPSSLIQVLECDEKFELGIISCHGDDMPGLRHSLLLSSQRYLSAAELLGLRVPKNLVLGACWSGRLDTLEGAEPFGLATVGLIRGARTVITALFDIPSISTAEILAEVYLGLAEGLPAIHALRRAQLRFRDVHPDATDSRWHGLVALSTSV
jgi:hypothetical protein